MLKAQHSPATLFILTFDYAIERSPTICVPDLFTPRPSRSLTHRDDHHQTFVTQTETVPPESNTRTTTTRVDDTHLPTLHDQISHAHLDSVAHIGGHRGSRRRHFAGLLRHDGHRHGERVARQLHVVQSMQRRVPQPGQGRVHDQREIVLVWRLHPGAGRKGIARNVQQPLSRLPRGKLWRQVRQHALLQLLPGH